MKLIRGCLLAVVVFGCLANAQTVTKPQKPYEPEPQTPQRPQPQRPQPPRPQQPQPQKPQPQYPQPPRPQQPQPQKPQPQYPQPPRPQPQKPQPQHPQPQLPKPPRPQTPQRPQPPRPQEPKDPKKTPPGKPRDEIWPPDFPFCDVPPIDRIACGPAGISEGECLAINCCFDGVMCYYGKYVTLQCTKEGFMIVVVSRDATLPNIDTDSLYFYESGEGCQPVGYTSSFLIYMFAVTSCGTVQWDEPGTVVYENRLYSSYETTTGDRGVITRDTSFDLLVQCRYLGTSIEALVIEVNPVPAPLPAASLGSMQVALYLGSGQCTVKGCVEEDVAYTSYYTDLDYPVVKVLRDPVYVEVVLLEQTDPNLVLTLGRCWVTADPYPYSYPQWDLIIDGCPNPNDNYLTKLLDTSTLPYPGHHRRFVFKMFTFMTEQGYDPIPQKVQSDSPPLVPSKQLMYIHCNTALCIQMPGSQCEPRCFRKARDIAASAVKKPRIDSITVSSKAIEIVSA